MSPDLRGRPPLVNAIADALVSAFAAPLDPVVHDGRMISNRWLARAGAVVAALLAAVFVPALAWAESSGAAEALRRRPRGMGFFGFGAVCCLIVVVVIVGGIVLLVRSRQK
jgi:hypothetical protein